ncbi:carbohydrate kinase family protein [Nonomuraea wenchangensis]
MKSRPRVLVMGDLCLDSVVETWLPHTWERLAASGEHMVTLPIADRVGGTAYHFAVRAVRFGLSPTVVGAVGQDTGGDAVAAQLAAAPFEALIQSVGSAPTARTIAVYDAGGARYMFASPVNANDALSAEFVRTCGVESMDLVWISGLCLRAPAAPRYAAVIAAAAMARERGIPVVLDVVPHDFHALFATFAEVSEVLGGLDGVVTEAHTARRMLGWEHRAERPLTQALSETAEALLEVTPLAVVRMRNGSTYHQVALTRSKHRTSYAYPVPTGSALLGYGDTLAAEALRDHLASLTGRR